MPADSTTPEAAPSVSTACGIAAGAITVLAALSLALVLHVLYVGEVHPVKHRVDAVPVGWPTPAPAACVMSGAVLAAAWIRAAMIRRRRPGVVTRLTRALVPASLPFVAGLPVLAGLLARPQQWSGNTDYLLLMVSICLLGWSAGAAARALGGIDLAAPAPAPAANQPSVLWLAVLGAVGLALVIFHTRMQVLMWQAWQLGSPDIGYYAEILQSVLRGQGLYCEAFGHTFFAEHSSPGLYLLVPLYALWPRIELLMVVGAAAVVSGVFAVYALARARGGSAATAAGLAVAYLLHPSTSRVIYGGSYGFHEILLALPLMLWSFVLIDRKRWIPASLCAAAALSFKEDVAVIYAMYGLYLGVFERQRIGWLWFAAASAYFLLVIYVIVPGFREGEDASYSKFKLYESLGGSPGGILRTLLHSPRRVLERLTNWHAIGFALALLVPLGLYPLRRPVLLAALPTFAFICLMDTPDFASIRFWHQTTLLPVLWLATVQAATGPRARPGALAGILTCAVLMHYALGFSPGTAVWQRLSDSAELAATREQKQSVMAQLQSLVPRQATLQATARLAAHFVDRTRVYPLHRKPPAPADWIVVDVRESWTGPETGRMVQELLNQALHSGDYEEVWSQGSVVALRRR